MNIYKVLLGVLLVLVIALGGPYAAAQAGYMPALNNVAWLILLITSIGLSVKCLVGDVVAGEFLFHKFGYDNCIMTFGAVLTAASLQLVSKTDLFPGVDTVALLKDLPPIGKDPVARRSVQLFVLLLVSLVATLVTAKVSAAIKHDGAKAPDALAFLNTIIGAGLLGTYVLVLISKGS
jgi:hypothetical protein